MKFLKSTILYAIFFLTLILFPLISANEDDVALEGPGRPKTVDEWRSVHQYKGRNAGGWRHDHWNGGVETEKLSRNNNKSNTRYDVSSWGEGYRSANPASGEIYDDDTSSYYPYYYEDDLDEGDEYYDESNPEIDGD